MQTKHTFKYWQWRVLISTMVGYSLFYFVRKNFSFAMPGLTAEYGITKTQLGIILTVIGVIYGVARYLHGIWADRHNARIHMSVGLLLCSLASFAFGFSVDIASFLTGGAADTGMFTNTLVLVIGFLLVFNNIFQGAGYPPCARLLSHWIPPQELATKQSIWNASHSIGASLVAMLCGWIMGNLGTDLSQDAATVAAVAEHLGRDITDPQVIESATHFGAWRYCFIIPAAIALVGSIFLFVTLCDTPSSVGLEELKGTEATSDIENDPAARKAFLRKMVYGNKYIWALAVTNFLVYVVRFSVLDWGPTFLKETRNMSMASAGWSVAVFEIFGVIGTLVAGWVTDKVFDGRPQRTCLWCMVGTALFMTLFFLLPDGVSSTALILILACAGFCIYGPQALIGIATSKQATKKGAATANGIVGIFGYLSVLISGLGFGALVDAINRVSPGSGWNYVFMIMIGIAVLGAVLFAFIWGMKADGYDKL